MEYVWQARNLFRRLSSEIANLVVLTVHELFCLYELLKTVYAKAIDRKSASTAIWKEEHLLSSDISGMRLHYLVAYVTSCKTNSIRFVVDT